MPRQRSFGIALAETAFVLIWLLALGAIAYPLLSDRTKPRPFCDAEGPPPSWGFARTTIPGSPDRHLESLWYAAIQDARLSDPNEVVTDLWEIAPSNPKLVWQDRDGQRRVRVASLMSKSKFETLFGPDGTRTEGTVPVTREVWVTPVPQLREFCQAAATADGDVERRTKQYLGLRWDWTYLGVVELWVRPEDLYRPCPDRAISNRSCALEIAAATAVPRQDADGWYCRLRARSYNQNGAPWTRLGYTYDWSEDSDTHVGASEYVVETGAVVELASEQTIPAYCYVTARQ